MEAKPSRSHEDFDPVCKWRRDEGRDTFEIHLPGFRREQIRVQVNHLGFIIVSGERPLDGTRWKRFKKQVELPKFCNVDAIHANFEQSILTVVMPKKVPPTQKQQEIREISADDEHKEIQEEKEEEQTGRRRYLAFRGWSIRELEGKQRHYDEDDHINAADDHHHHHHHHHQQQQHDDHHLQHGDHHLKHGDQLDGHRGHDDDDQFVKHHSGIPPDTTRDIAFKLMIVVIVILVITSYITDMCKSIMADSFHY